MLPFELALTTLRSALAVRDIELADFLQTFDGTDSRVVTAARLRVAPRRLDVLRGAPTPTIAAVWGEPGAAAPNWFAKLAAQLPAFLERSGISYDELAELVRLPLVRKVAPALAIGLRTVPPGGAIGDRECDIDELALVGLGAEPQQRIPGLLHRLTVLRRATGWPLETLGAAIELLTRGSGDMSAKVLDDLGALVALCRREQLPPEVVISALASHATTPIAGSLARVCIARHAARFLAADLPAASGGGARDPLAVAADPVSGEPAAPFLDETLDPFDPDLRAIVAPALGVAAADLPRLRPLAPGKGFRAFLSLDAHVALAERAGVSLTDLVVFDALSVVESPFGSLKNLQQSLDRLSWLRHVGLTAGELDLALRGSDASGVRTDDRAATRAQTALAAAQANTELFRADPGPMDARRGQALLALQTELSALGWTSERVDELLELAHGNAAGVAVPEDAKAISIPAVVEVPLSVEDPLEIPPTLADRVTYDARNALLRLDGRLTDDERSLLRALDSDPAYHAAIDALIAAARAGPPLLESFSTEHIAAAVDRARAARRRMLVIAAVSALTGTSDDLASTLLQRVRLATLPGRPSLLAVLSDKVPDLKLLGRVQRAGLLAGRLGPDPRNAWWLLDKERNGSQLADIVSGVAANPAELAQIVVEASRLRAVADLWNAPYGVVPALLDAGAPSPLAQGPAATPLDRLRRLLGRTDDRQGLREILGAATELPAERIAEASERFRLARAVGARVAECQSWARARDVSAADAAAARVESLFSAQQWAVTGAAMLNRLRVERRDALVAFIVHSRGLSGAEALSGLLVTDVLVGPDETTTRIRHALNAVQLFVQRCQLGLEGHALRPDPKVDAGWDQWPWMGRYRVWEAQRRIFVNPENFVEPDLRRDQSEFFSELETDLLQSDLSDEASEDAFRSYLDKLDRAARPRVLGFFRERVASIVAGVQRDVLHVVARSARAPYAHYYRTLDGTWSPWEVLPIDITHDQVVPVIWNRRLLVFWPVIVPDAPTSPPSAPALEPQPLASLKVQPPAAPVRRVRLAWTERRHGKWLAKQLTDEYCTVVVRTGFDTIGVRVVENGDRLDVDVTYAAGSHEATAGKFRMAPTEITAFDLDHQFPPVPPPQNMSYRRGKLVGRAISLRPGWALVPAARPYEVTLESCSPELDVGSEFFFADGDRGFFVNGGSETIPFGGAGGVAPAAEVGELPAKYHQLLPGEAEQAFGLSGDEKWAHVRHALGDGAATRVAVALPPVSPAATERQARRAATDRLAPLSAAPAVSVHDVTVEPDTSLLRWGPRAPMLVPPLGRRLLDGPVADVATRWRERARVSADGVSGSYVQPVVSVIGFYHPYTEVLVEALARSGVEGMLARDLQVAPWNFQPMPHTGVRLDFKATYQTNDVYVRWKPVEDLDFGALGAYSSYNWELFFHAPYLVATRLWANRQFDAALRWLRLILDPTDGTMAPGDPPDRVRSRWRTRPFYERAAAEYRQQRIEALLANTADPSLQFQVARWREHPFDPHAVATLRSVAYQKAVFMRYLDVLIGAGDAHFAAGTSEELNVAYQYYAYAADMLDRKPPGVERTTPPSPRTFRTLGAAFAGFSTAMVAAEHLIAVAPPTGGSSAGPPVSISTLVSLPYFCVPPNARLGAYWDTVEDRLHKLRNSLDLMGNRRVTDLWGRQLDPAAVARLMATGLSLQEALAELSAPAPRHRFRTLLAHALDLAGEASRLGQALLSAIEKHDAEQIAVLRATHETQLLDRLTVVRAMQLQAADHEVVAARSARDAADTRRRHYQGLLDEAPDSGAAGGEQRQLDKLDSATDWATASSIIKGTAALLNAIPQIKMGPFIIGAELGGIQLSAIVNTGAVIAEIKSAIDRSESELAGLRAGLGRRRHDWTLQRDLAAADVGHLDHLHDAAVSRREAARRERDGHVAELEESRAVLEVMTAKFSTQQLFSWMVRQLSTLHQDTYNLAFRLARQAERAWQQELYRQDRLFIRPGAWDSERKGLLAPDRLLADLKAMDAAYLDADDRLHEVTKSISLRLLDAGALAELVTRGACSFVLPEWLYDLVHPGHYQRRIRSVAVTIPCVTGPYTSVNARLHLNDDRIRRSPKATSASGYAAAGDGDERFEPSGRAGASIVTSHGQNDTGLFDGGQGDDRLLPFEHAGAISRWTLVLPSDTNGFDTSTVSDVVLQVRYTARYDDQLAQHARGHLDKVLGRPPIAATAPGDGQRLLADPDEFVQLIDLRSEYSDTWARNLTTPTPFEIDVSKERLPYALRRSRLKLTGVRVWTDGGSDGLRLAVDRAEPVPAMGSSPFAFDVDDLDLAADHRLRLSTPRNAAYVAVGIQLATA
jgi:hypothetical protein